MKVNFFILLTVTISFCSLAKSQTCATCPSCDSVLTGTYNGNISWGSGSGTLCIASGAIINGNVNNTSLEDICIQGTVNGDVTNESLGEIYLSGTINGDVDNQNGGNFFSSGLVNGDIIIGGVGDFCNDGVVKNGTLTLSSTGDFNNYGAASFIGDVTISGTGLINSDCSVKIGGSLYITGVGDVTLSGELIINGDLVPSSVGDLIVTGSIQVNGDVNLSGGGDIIIEGNLIVAGNTTVSGTSNINLESGAYFSTNNLSLISGGDVVGVGAITGQVVILGVGSTGSITSKFEDNLDVCGSCAGCNSSGGVTFSSAPCPNPPTINLNLSANCITVLPISLLSFVATPINQSILLKWITTTEINNNYFTIEKSKDAINWAKLVDVLGAGNSTQELHYSTSDNEPYSGISYYRLKQTDFDGQFSFSKIIVVNTNFVIEDIVSNVYPNPSNKWFEFVNYQYFRHLKVEIRNVHGELVFSQLFVDLIKGENHKIEVLSIPSGVYTIQFISEKSIANQKIIIAD